MKKFKLRELLKARRKPVEEVKTEVKKAKTSKRSGK